MNLDIFRKLINFLKVLHKTCSLVERDIFLTSVVGSKGNTTDFGSYIILQLVFKARAHVKNSTKCSPFQHRLSCAPKARTTYAAKQCQMRTVFTACARVCARETTHTWVLRA